MFDHDPAARFEIYESRMATGGLRLALSGELDLSVVELLTVRLLQVARPGASVRLDLSKLEFIDSTGLAAIVGAFRHAQLDGWDLSVEEDAMPQVRRLLELTGLDKILWGAGSGRSRAEERPDGHAR
jgi:anti-sigma B factor antagonist